MDGWVRGSPLLRCLRRERLRKAGSKGGRGRARPPFFSSIYPNTPAGEFTLGNAIRPPTPPSHTHPRACIERGGGPALSLSPKHRLVFPEPPPSGI